MLRTALTMLMIGTMAAWGQAQGDAVSGSDKIDRADAYYHYALAQRYAKLAAKSGGRNREYVDKAIENYKAAIKADPETPMLREELADFQAKGPGSFFPLHALELPAR
jgi:uncharacterized protein (DUF952 family)